MIKENLLRPIFVLGNPRSGTTLLRLTITSHPLICVPPESHFFLWLEQNYSNWKLNDGFNAYLDDLMKCTKIETWHLNHDNLRDYLIRKEPSNYAELNASVYSYYCSVNKPKAKFWGDKNMPWVGHTDKIIELYPAAMFIHIHRDGRDIACSYKELNTRRIHSKYAPKLPNNIEEIANKWKENITLFRKIESQIDDNHFLHVSYEDLVLNQEMTSKKICSFLNVDYPDSGMTHLNDSNADNDEPEEFMQWKEKTKEPVDSSNIGKYKSHLSQNEIDLFESICKEELSHFGYVGR